MFSSSSDGIGGHGGPSRGTETVISLMYPSNGKWATVRQANRKMLTNKPARCAVFMLSRPSFQVKGCLLNTGRDSSEPTKVQSAEYAPFPTPDYRSTGTSHLGWHANGEPPAFQAAQRGFDSLCPLHTNESPDTDFPLGVFSFRGVAQWQSAGFIPRMTQVRFLPRHPN